ncbi:DUF4012 domain-containing protein [Kineococcus terrestris]|uniref:DUF4012 domain-containing protein n=1 Tax=Kineococcus terrestris TaxID=2044856 RepID=UPI0034DB2489
MPVPYLPGPAGDDARGADGEWEESPGARRRRLRRRRLAPLRLVLLLLVLLLAAWVAAVAVSGVQAGRALQRVAAAAPQLEDAVRAQDFAGASQVAEGVAADARTAARATGQWPWRAAQAVPWVGEQLGAVGAGSRAAALLTEPLPGALDLAHDVLGEGLVSADRTVDVDAVRELSPVVTDYAGRVQRARAALAAGTGEGVLRSISSRLEPVERMLGQVEGPLTTAADVVPQLPSMLGADGPRTYLVAFTNPAEPRPVQGIFGAYAYLGVDGGRIELVSTGTDNDLYAARADPSVLGEEYVALYGADAGRVQNVTLGAQADDAGRLAADLVVDAGLPRPDAVVFVDPVGLAQLLGPDHEPLDLGPFGQVATADLPDVLMREAYVRFEGDQDARKAFLAVTSAAAFEAVLADGLSTSAAAGAREAVATGHLAVWSSVPAEQEALVAAGVAHVLGDPALAGGRAHLALTNTAPSKLEYWVQPSVEVQPPCASVTGEAVGALQLTLVNTAPEDVPGYMRNATARTAADERTAQDVVSLWVPPWLGLDGASVDGAPVPTAVDAEHGWRLVRLTVDLPPGVPVVVRWQLRGPAEDLPREVRGPSTAAAPVVTIGTCLVP